MPDPDELVEFQAEDRRKSPSVHSAEDEEFSKFESDEELTPEPIDSQTLRQERILKMCLETFGSEKLPHCNTTKVEAVTMIARFLSHTVYPGQLWTTCCH